MISPDDSWVSLARQGLRTPAALAFVASLGFAANVPTLDEALVFIEPLFC